MCTGWVAIVIGVVRQSVEKQLNDANKMDVVCLRAIFWLKICSLSPRVNYDSSTA
jgi:hypothetical protein